MAEGMRLRSNALRFQTIDFIGSTFCCGSNPQREPKRFIEIRVTSILASTACCIAQMSCSAESGAAYCAISGPHLKTDHYARHPTALGRHAFNGLIASLEDGQHYAAKGLRPLGSMGYRPQAPDVSIPQSARAPALPRPASLPALAPRPSMH